MSGQLERLLEQATPGPWRHDAGADDYIVFGSVPGQFVGHGETPENARLIALAPDLARLLVDAMAALEEYSQHGVRPERLGVPTMRACWEQAIVPGLLARFAVLEQRAGEGQG